MSTVALRTRTDRRDRVRLDFATPELLELHALFEAIDPQAWNGSAPDSLEAEGTLLAAHQQRRPMGVAWTLFTACVNRESCHARIQGYDASRPYYLAAAHLALLLVEGAQERGVSALRFWHDLNFILHRHPDADVREMALCFGGAS